jgi:1-acyl-sn-glycerol-3-phosphate acyltransferase
MPLAVSPQKLTDAIRCNMARTSAAQRPLWKRAGYSFLRVLARILGVLLFRIRCLERQRIPADGALLVCSNHQSFFDPVLVGMWFQRQLNYLARQSLWGIAPLRWLIEYLDAIPIDRDGFGLAGIKETMKRLKRGEIVLIFPEGTRTRDGEMSSLKPGFVSLARRTDAALLPVAMDGAYDAWPRSARWPRPSRVVVCFGEPITAQQAAALDDEALVRELERRMRECHAAARASRQR